RRSRSLPSAEESSMIGMRSSLLISPGSNRTTGIVPEIGEGTRALRIDFDCRLQRGLKIARSGYSHRRFAKPFETAIGGIRPMQIGNTGCGASVQTNQAGDRGAIPSRK